MPLLSELIAAAKIDAPMMGDAGVMIDAVTTDSRAVKPGTLFAAMPGVNADGAQYIPDALRQGAAAVMMAASSRTDVVATVPMIRVGDMRASVSAVAAAFYAKQPRYEFAITGTDGKTSTADFVRQLTALLGKKSASIGTLGLRSPNDDLNAAFPANNTSPEPVLLHHTLQALAEVGVEYVAIETSSHGLDQKRADGVKFCAGAFTNLTRDHLDYHRTFDAYFEAKARLFSHVLPGGATAVLYHDDARFAALKSICDARSIKLVSFGAHADATYRIASVTPHADGLSATVMIRGNEHTLDLPFYGAFQLNNMLTAIGLLSAADIAEETLLPLLSKLQGVPGRLQKVVSANGAPIFVDYAHTPAALENILKTLRPHTAKKLHVVFGCGGDRDAGKRPEMGAAAAQYADVVTVTDDNPRSENAAAIRATILAAAPGAQEIPDRAAAIRHAVQQLQAGDVLVVAGKGHETTQTIGNQVIHFNDAEHIREAVAA